ncbi:hypothetical protein LT980_14495 [Citrobacter portucalensis]|uniref:hypothetical protein n=1 Tax=Citrobacter portucalensis TaxID=1639133 RepID=UPI00202CAC35|nr:hypothetical protein [Citrobacter portucalensis]URR11154.1 hypothetical protein LT980_14495 [Citrobacter portucalensis]
MGKKVPIVVHADPDVETTFTIKPFSAGLAKSVSIDDTDVSPQGHTGTASATSTPQGNDADADYDYSG